MQPEHLGDSWGAARFIATQARRRVPVLWFGGWVLLALSVPLALLGLWDDRTLLGVSVWTKPWKFHVSVGLHLLTLAWFAAMLRDTPERAQNMARMTWVVICSAVFELVYITWRAALGEASHFNVGSPFAGAMYALMGVGAVSLTASAGWLGWNTLKARDHDWGALLQRGVGVGLMMGFVLATLSGSYMSAQSGHHVGDGLATLQSLPVVGWSLQVGDLRVAHFFGLHAMHVLPVVAWLLARQVRHAIAARAFVGIAAAYAGFTILTFIQAVMGRPLL